MRNYTFLAGNIAMAKKGQVGREPWRPSPPTAEPKEAALRCLGDIRREAMEREGLIFGQRHTDHEWRFRRELSLAKKD